MAIYTCDKINRYAKYISDTEDKLCFKTLSKIKNIFLNNGFSINNHKYIDNEGLTYSFSLKDSSGNEFLFLVQGSFANGTCIRQDSDLDIAIISEKTFRPNFRSGVTSADYGFVDSSFNILEFKKQVTKMLIDNGFKAKIGNKCINVDFEESGKKSFDIVPCLRYKDYTDDYAFNVNNFVYGTLIKSEDGKERINYPEQSIKNNIEKNNNTNYYFKKVVRILKNIKRDMEDDGFELAKKVSSFELECLISNVADVYFKKNPLIDQQEQLKSIAQQVLKNLFDYCDCFPTYYETNGILNIYDDPKKNIDITIKFIKQMYAYFE